MISKRFEPDDAFVDYYYVVDKSSLIELYESGEIVNIQRDYSESTGFNRLIEYVPENSILVEYYFCSCSNGLIKTRERPGWIIVRALS